MKNQQEHAGRIAWPKGFRPRLRHIYARAKYFGFRFQCPFCGSRLRRLLTFGLPFAVLREKRVIGSGIRENALCPVCFAIDRHRLLYLYLRNKTNIFSKPTKLLHVAPEPRVTEVLRAAANIDYLSSDLSPHGAMIAMDITKIQFANESFDAIICNHVLGNVSDDRKAFSELYRTLKPGGWAILQVPISEVLQATYEDPSITTVADRERAFGEGYQVRLYAEDYAERLTSAGFKVDVFDWTAEKEKFGGQSNLFALNEREKVYRVTKPG